MTMSQRFSSILSILTETAPNKALIFSSLEKSCFEMTLLRAVLAGALAYISLLSSQIRQLSIFYVIEKANVKSPNKCTQSAFA
jgi:hypothetical protein